MLHDRSKCGITYAAELIINLQEVPPKDETRSIISSYLRVMIVTTNLNILLIENYDLKSEKSVNSYSLSPQKKQKLQSEPDFPNVKSKN